MIKIVDLIDNICTKYILNIGCEGLESKKTIVLGFFYYFRHEN